MNAGASAIQGKKLSGERIANLKKMSECPALSILSLAVAHAYVFVYLSKCVRGESAGLMSGGMGGGGPVLGVGSGGGGGSGLRNHLAGGLYGACL